MSVPMSSLRFPTDDEYMASYRACAILSFGLGQPKWASASAMQRDLDINFARLMEWLRANCRQHPGNRDCWQLEEGQGRVA